MREIAKPMMKNQYGQYLLKVIEELKGKPPILRIALLLIMDDKEYCGKCDA